MKILDIQTGRISLPLARPFKTALRTVETLSDIVVRVITDEGEGYGEAPPTAGITGVVKAPDGSTAIKAEETGFDGGILTVIMGFDANGAEIGIWVDASTQTKGIGSNVSSDDFLAQFDGMDGTQNIVMNQDYDAYSGATISSTALFAAINDCVNCYNELA